MFNKIKSTIKRLAFGRANPLVGQFYIDEVLPRFHDHAKTTNKTLWIVRKVVSPDIVKVLNLDQVRDLGLSNASTQHVDISRKTMVTQNGIPVKLTNRGWIICGDWNFQKEGYSPGDLYSFVGLGYFTDINQVARVFFVTDQYVFFKTLDSDRVIKKYTFEELRKLSPELKE